MKNKKQWLYWNDLICWTVYTNLNLIWIWLRAHFGQLDQRLAHIFSIAYHLLNNGCKWLKSGAKFRENGLNSFPTEINRNLSFSPVEARLSHLLASASAHNNTFFFFPNYSNIRNWRAKQRISTTVKKKNIAFKHT